MSLPLNQVVLGDCAEVMQGWPADSIDLVVTSPPYWGLRDYGSETVRVWGGLPECEHEWGINQPPIHEGQVTQTKYGDRPSSSEGGVAPTGNFCINCGAWSGSLGLEPHPQLFVDHLVEICCEVKRVLKPSGTFWLNLGDTYYGSGGKGGQYEKFMPDKGQPDHYRQSSKTRSNWLQPKQLLGMPWRVAIALQNDSWILRNDIIWHKPNHMPSSVKDRLTCAYEHVFLFVKNNKPIYWIDKFTGKLSSLKPEQYYVHDETGKKRFDRPKKEVDKDCFDVNGLPLFSYAWQGYTYYFDLDAIRVPHAYPETFGKRPDRGKTGDGLYTMEAGKRSGHPKGKNPGDVLSGSKYLEQDHPHSIRVKGGHTGDYTHPRGKNPGDFWSVPTRPFPGAHFATFPPGLIEPIIKAGSPRWICSKCGKPRIRISETEHVKSPVHGAGSIMGRRDGGDRLTHYNGLPRVNAVHHTVGWSDCGCGEKWVGGVVLDPFGGSGTVGKVARRLGRRFILIELVPEYADMARQRVRGRYKPVPEGVTPFTQFMEAEE